MPIEMDREGVFRGKITEYELKEFDSGSTAIALVCTTDEMWDADSQTWIPWAEYDMEARGDIFIIGKGGKLLDNNIRDLNRYAGWDGNPMSVVNGEWNTLPIQFTIKLEANEKFGDKFRLGFIKAYDKVPGGQFTCDPEQARQIANKYGSKFRALCSEVPAAAKPAGKPATPPRPPKPAPLTPANVAAQKAGSSADPGDVPF